MKKIDSPDNVSLIKKQLEAQTREHNLLKNQIPNHEQFLKMMDRFEDSLVSLGEMLGHRLSQIKQWLEYLETVEKTNSNASAKTNDSSAMPLSAQKDQVTGDRYKEFLKEQKKRKEDLAAKCKSATKKLNFPDSSHDVIMKKIDSPDNISLIKKQLEAQTREHNLLKNQIPDQEQFLKMMDRFEDSLFSLVETLGHRLSQIKQWLEYLETVKGEITENLLERVTEEGYIIDLKQHQDKENDLCNSNVQVILILKELWIRFREQHCVIITLSSVTHVAIVQSQIKR
ncbi:unnamed protein product [Porites lobata]|uniref:Uncharacterized protein n=1 Tax=Porites lobata TaxID=104759 RepID=A0ABN8S1T5_9CNID|nr:unnamed protein product [Porites lobata]